MKLSQKMVAAAVAASAAFVVVAPANAEDVTTEPTTTQTAVDKQKAQAELTSQQLDNAKKGVETANGILDGLGKISDLLGFNASATAEAEADC